VLSGLGQWKYLYVLGKFYAGSFLTWPFSRNRREALKLRSLSWIESIYSTSIGKIPVTHYSFRILVLLCYKFRPCSI
jgi:hypothetical protein